MDWARAKWILITVFLLLDLFLGYRLWGRLSYTVSRPQDIERLLDELIQQGIYVKAAIPNRAPTMPLLVVGKAQEDISKLVKEFFGNAKTEQVVEGGFSRISGSDGEVRIWQDGTVEFVRTVASSPQVKNPWEPRGVWGKGWAESVANSFLVDHEGLSAQFSLDAVSFQAAEEAYLVRFLQNYQGWPLFNAGVEVTVTRSGVTRYRKKSLEPKGFANVRKPVIPAHEALARVKEELENRQKPVIISEVTLGYLATFYHADTWELIPVWRIKLEQGQGYAVNAYTGELAGQ